MKNYFSRLILLFAIFVSLGTKVAAQFVVKIRPTAPVIVRTVAPSPRHIWVDGEWAWRGNNYQYVNGYWVAPPRVRGVWVPGHWKNTRRGWVWKTGHWRR
jgi:hypothetical protein